MHFVILSGFLGSGKTTVLLSLARYLTQNFSDEKIVIIENEIGEANVDGLLLKETSYNVRNLAAGCICCTLTGELVAAMEDIQKEINPSWLLIEATGIAHQTISDVVSQTLRGVKPYSIVIVDSERWEELMDTLPMLISTQIEIADLILLNKIDTISDEELVHVLAEVRDINSESSLHKISAASDDLSKIWLETLEKVEDSGDGPLTRY